MIVTENIGWTSMYIATRRMGLKGSSAQRPSVALNLKISFPLLITTKVCENKNNGRRSENTTTDGNGYSYSYIIILCIRYNYILFRRRRHHSFVSFRERSSDSQKTAAAAAAGTRSYSIRGLHSLFDCDSKGRYPRAVRTLIPVGTCRPNGPVGELLVPESRPAGDLHLRPRPHTEPVTIILNDRAPHSVCIARCRHPPPRGSPRTSASGSNGVCGQARYT